MNVRKNEDSIEHTFQSQCQNCPSGPILTFPKSLRLLTSKDFSNVFGDAPLRASHPNFLILCRPNLLETPRLGLVVAKKNCRRAHDRNRIKRHIRETFRQQQHNLPAIDAIVLARRGADTIPPADLNAILFGLWKRIIKRATKPQSTKN